MKHVDTLQLTVNTVSSHWNSTSYP